jgi:hypothetical protein
MIRKQRQRDTDILIERHTARTCDALPFATQVVLPLSAPPSTQCDTEPLTPMTTNVVLSYGINQVFIFFAMLKQSFMKSPGSSCCQMDECIHHASWALITHDMLLSNLKV